MEQNNNNTALLIMDVQGATMKMMADKTTPLINSLTTAIQTARSKNIPVIYVVVGFRKGYPEASMNNKSFARIKSSGANFDTEEASRVDTSVVPQPGEIIITKKRVSAFTGSDLEVVLRSQGIKHIVLTGIATSGVVLSTLREAADKDYAITVLSDCCADADEEIHRVLTTKIFPRQAEVIISGDWKG
jgi:nicotinamidase-related amidase